jgi:hypothetical protein
MMVCTAVTVLVLCALASVAGASPLLPGDWQIFSNGAVGNFHIIAVDAAGHLTATVYGDPTTGFYNASTNQILFLRQTGSTLATIQQYSGQLQIIQGTPGGCTHALTGTFTVFSSDVTAANSTLGWAAIITAPC